MGWKYVFITILSLAQLVFGANILYVSPVASPSHHIWNREIALELAKSGHNVTMLTHDEERERLPQNLTIILMEGVYEKIFEAVDYMSIAETQARNSFWDAVIIYDWVKGTAKLDFETRGLAQLMRYPKDYTFDLIVFDNLISQFHYPIIDRFNRPPVVAVTPLLIHNIMTPAFGGNVYPSYNPHYSSTYTDKLSMLERFYNSVYVYLDQIYRRYYFLKDCETMAREYYGDVYVRPLEEYERNFSVLLSNYDPLLDYSVALPPNVISVGALHAHRGKELPNDLQIAMDGAKDGVILFSLGTNMKSKALRGTLKNSMIEALGRLKQTVIWKYEEDISGLPKNIIIRKWLPQNDMMEHPNLKVFITHGGALSTQEAMYHGVPVVGIPFFGDQICNIKKMVSRGLGQQVLISELTADNLHSAIVEVIDNKKYADASRRISRLLRDKPLSSLDTAMYWIERTLEHGTINEYRLASANMTIIELYNLDILSIIALTLLCFVFALFKVVNWYLKNDCKKKFKQH